MRTVLITLLLFIGVELWFLVMKGIGIRPGQPMIIATAAIVAMIRPVARAFADGLEHIRRPSRRASFVTGVAIFIASTLFLYFQATYQHRDFSPKYHDEFSYIIQARMLAHGRLWEPAHPLPEFFESFQLLATPVYASIYFPGAAMFYAAGIWFHWPHWLIPLLLSGVSVALLYRVITELVDGIAGFLGVIMMISLPVFREQTIMVMAQIPTLVLELALVWSWMRWRQRRGWIGACMMGVIAGWLCVTRPIDALVICVPVGVAVLIDLRTLAWNRAVTLAGLSIACALPFLLLQLLFNRAVTGHAFETPFNFYTRQVYPQATYGFHRIDPSIRPTWPVPQVQEAYQDLLATALSHHTPAGELHLWLTDRLPAIAENLSSHRLLIVLLPVGFIGLKKRRWVLFATLPLFVGLYFPYVFFIKHYTLTVLPAVIMLYVLAVDVLANSFPKARSQVLAFLFVAVAGLSVAEWPQFDRFNADENFVSGQLRQVDHDLNALPHKPAIVLFRFSRGAIVALEPAYNTDVVWPDDAPVIRAHDLGDEDAALFAYYAKRQPDRWVYRYDLGENTLTDLGPVTALAERPR